VSKTNPDVIFEKKLHFSPKNTDLSKFKEIEKYFLDQKFTPSLGGQGFSFMKAKITRFLKFNEHTGRGLLRL